jgi:RNA polymerase sigma factor (sigma-70 family)
VRPGSADGPGDIAAFDALLAAARAGSPWAWRSLYTELAPVVAGYLRAQGVRDPDAVASDVWLGVFGGIGSFVGDAARFRSWLFVIAHRRMLDDRRRASRAGDGLEPDEAQPPAPAAEEAALTSLATERVLGVLQRLAPDQRDVLVLRIVADLTVAQIAEVLGKSEGAVKALQRRGLEAVRRILSSEGVPL